MAALSKITTIKDFERALPGITKIFDGNESDCNWEARERTLTAIRDLIRLQASSIDWKDTLAKGVQTLSDGIARSVNSLRTTLALEAIGTVGDISIHLGHAINAFTIDLLLINLLRCASTTKKVIATHAMEATIKLLSSTPYRQRNLKHVCNMMEEKNVQARHYAAIYIKTLLTTHSTSTSMNSKSAGLDMVEKNIRKGLLDAAPHVREASRQIYMLLQQYWPARATRLCQTLDAGTQAKLSKLSDVAPASLSVTVPHQSLLLPPSSSSDTRPVRSKLMSQKTTGTIARPLSQRPTPSSSTTLSNNLRRLRTATTSLNPVPSKRRREESDMHHSSSAGSTMDKRRTSAASVSIASSRGGDSTRPNRSYLAAASLLQMLRSNDVATNCKGIYKLASKLKHCPYKQSQRPVLPQDVPSFTTLHPLLMDYLSRDTDNIEFHETLMSWDCLAGVFTRVLCLHHYIPPIILASKGCKRTDGKTIPTTTLSGIYEKGAARLKLYLKHCDPELPGRLLSILVASRELGYPAKYRQYLIQWIDELLCEYVGLLNDEDGDDIKKGADDWIVARRPDEQWTAYRWFDDEVNTKKCLSAILPILENIAEDAEEYSALLVLVGRLRMSNERVFEAIAHQYRRAMERLTYSRPGPSYDQQTTNALDEFDTTLGLIRLDEKNPMACETHSDTTHEFSNLLVSIASEDATNGEENSGSLVVQVNTQGPARWSQELSELLQRLQRQQDVSDVELQSILKRLQVVSGATPVLQHEHIYSAQGDMWIGSPGRGRCFLLLMEILIGFLMPPLSPSHKDRVQTQAIILIKHILTNQAGILNYYEQRSLNGTKKEDNGTTGTSNDSVSYALAKALLFVFIGEKHADECEEMITAAKETLNLLTIKVPEDISVRILWGLLGNEQIAGDKDAATFLFSRIGNLAPVVSRTVWADLLGHGSAKILIQGTNHLEATVRRACVQAIVGIYQVMGDMLLIDELAPSLRADQIELLKHYIHKK
ncbi:clasp N terminal-domain-containing protein [Dichotomocladium elegans]|nr:clasp N terminal-domain-containing protein [Dichotomocladium elegans]